MAKLLKSLDLSDKIKFGMHQIDTESPQVIIWRIVAKNHSSIPEYPVNAITLLTDKVIDHRAMDSYEPDNPDSFRKQYGNNRYLHSNLLQWLNSDAREGMWYTPQHDYDAPPENAAGSSNQTTFYAQRAGFLRYFTKKEVQSILQTTCRTVKNISVDGSGYDDVISNVFIPSKTEVGLTNENNIEEGAKWPVFSDQGSRLAYTTEQSFINSSSKTKPLSLDMGCSYWLRTPNSAATMTNCNVTNSGAGTSNATYQGTVGVRPALNLSGDTLVSDTADEDGCYTVIFDDPPIITTARSGGLGVQSVPLKLDYSVTDPDADILTVTEKINGTVIRILSNQPYGTELTFDLTALWQTLALDSVHTGAVEVSDGILTTIREWTFTRVNDPPTITTDSDGDLGKLAVPFRQEYMIDDVNMDTLSVIEKLDGQTLRTLPAQPGRTKLIFDLTAQWAALSRDVPHTAVIEIKDGSLTTTHAWTFRVTDPIEQHITSSQSVIRPTGVVIPVLPVQVLVTNNAHDSEPVWEDASKEYLERRQHLFKNNVKTSDAWCVGVKYTVYGASLPVKLTTRHELSF